MAPLAPPPSPTETGESQNQKMRNKLFSKLWIQIERLITEKRKGNTFYTILTNQYGKCKMITFMAPSPSETETENKVRIRKNEK